MSREPISYPIRDPPLWYWVALGTLGGLWGGWLYAGLVVGAPTLGRGMYLMWLTANTLSCIGVWVAGRISHMNWRHEYERKVRERRRES